MGITNLLPSLAPVTTHINLQGSIDKKDLSGGSKTKEPSRKRRRLRTASTTYGNSSSLRVGIDVSAWISSACHGYGAHLLDERHFTNFGRAELLSTRKDKSSSNKSDAATDVTRTEDESKTRALDFIRKATQSVMNKIESLATCIPNSNILVVFDGASPPIKARCCKDRTSIRTNAAKNRNTVISRKVSDETSMEIDEEEMKSNLSKISAAKKAGAHSAEIYYALVNAVLNQLREEQIPFLVSPYEADGQLAYLAKKGLIHLVVSEDSDFVGHATPAVLYKFRVDSTDRDTDADCIKATGKLIQRSELGSVSSFPLIDFSDVMLAVLCVSAGCDFCTSLKGVGIATARNCVEEVFLFKRKNQTTATTTTRIQRLLDLLYTKCRQKLTEQEKAEYENNFLAALVMFRHPIVFDPICARCVFAWIDHPDPELVDYEKYASLVNDEKRLEGIVGTLHHDLACHIVEGWINPKTWTLRNKTGTPANVCAAFAKWEVENAVRKGTSRQSPKFSTSQSSTENSSATRFSTQGSSQNSSNMSVDILSPNMLSIL